MIHVVKTTSCLPSPSHHFLFGGLKCINHAQSWLGKNGIVLPTFKRPMVQNPQSSDGDGFTFSLDNGETTISKPLPVPWFPNQKKLKSYRGFWPWGSE